jgi:hypothetical protein
VELARALARRSGSAEGAADGEIQWSEVLRIIVAAACVVRQEDRCAQHVSVDGVETLGATAHERGGGGRMHRRIIA